MIGCHCVQLMKPLSGMPIFLTIKVIPQDGNLTALDDKQISKVHASLREQMRDISENISVDFICIYEIKTELISLLNLSSWCLVMVEWLFLAVPRGCLQFVIVVFPDHTHLLS